MTKNKRFVNKGKDIFQYGEWWCSANGEHCADVIATAINELIEENEQLKSENKNLKSNVDDLMNMELEDRDIVCQAGKFRLEEWGKHRLHQFYDGDILLEDETVVIRLMDLTTENKQLKQQIKDLYKFVKYDVDNEIDVYPKSILEHLVNILKIIGDVE